MDRSITLARLALAGAVLVAFAAVGCGDDDSSRPKPARDAGTSNPSDDRDAQTDAHGVQCGDKFCAEPALCLQLDKPRCFCPVGYIDTNGDGSDCDDLDECQLPNICDLGGKCTNTPGSYVCECDAPSHRLEGKFCLCSPGYTRTSEGLCLAQDGRGCDDNLDCLNNHCEGGTCCAKGCDAPGDCQTSEGATCSDGKSCAYVTMPDGTSCDDAHACTRDSKCQDGKCMLGVAENCDDGNPCTDDSCKEPIGCEAKNNSNDCDDHNDCTSHDRCNTGSCRGELKSCDGDLCNDGVCDPSNGNCGKKAKTDNTLCDDGSSCSIGDACAAGSCRGQNACGSSALTCSVGGMGSPNACTCLSDFVDDHAGHCVPVNNECASVTPCSSDADCLDPSNTPGDLVCTCKPGFAGNGATCSPAEPCQDNPCGDGRGSCTAADGGRYSCACNPGYVAIGGTCMCDLSGTFAVRSRLDLSWDRMSDAIEPGTDTVYSYAIERHGYDAQGNLTLELNACGDSPLDFCGIGIAPVVAAETYSQFLPVQIWELSSMPVVMTRLRVPRALPGASFETETITTLRGVSLTDPAGAWPESYHDIAGTPYFDGSAVNGATWIDHDSDNVVGITSYVVPPGGIQADGVAPDPAVNYGATSPVCPRTGGQHTPYEYWPAPAFGDSQPIRVKRMYTASRVMSSYKGKLVSCDEFSGDIVGPNNGSVRLEARVGGCIRTNGDAETACSTSAIDFIDAAAQSQTVLSSSFKVKRLPSDVAATCANVRAFDFD